MNTLMSRVLRILPEWIANRIAAGEVVERPASAVKEMLENAVDAGATEISLHVDERGFRIVDDGCGMTRDECLLALERHATSKIADVDDLDRIATLGFRGEALPSIASVSRFRLQSRPRDASSGTEVVVEGGRLVHVREIGIPVGTAVEVQDLFFNTPARRKFMKSAATENGHIRETFTRVALGFPEIGFRYESGGRMVYDVPAGLGPRERAGRLLGNEFARHATEFARRSASLDYGIAGLLGHPRDNRARQDELHWFVNGRYIRDRSLNHAVVKAYREFMPDNRYPRAIFFLTMPPGEVDVNVHPTKQEVRFARGRELYGFLAGAVAQALEEWLRDDPNPAALGPNPALGRSADPRAATPASFGAAFGRTPGAAAAFASPSSGEGGRAPAAYGAGSPFSPMLDTQAQLRRKEAVFEVRETAPAADAGFYGRLAYLGQALGTYLVCQSDEGIVLVDQHAAHERVTFNAMLEAYRSGRPPVQGMLVPQVLELPPVALEAIQEHAETLRGIGFELAPFSGNAVAVTGVPAALAGREIRRVVLDVAQELNELGRADVASQAVAERIIGCACQGSVRANQPLSEPEVRALLRQLDEIERAGNCPHGRPVVVTLSRAEIERRFGRSGG